MSAGQTPSAPPPGAVISPDGREWWDGTAWRQLPPPPPAPAPPAPPPQHLGFWARHRLVVAAKHYRAQMAEWQTHVEGLREYLRLVDTFTGVPAPEGVVVAAGEQVYGSVSGAALVETRVRGGHWISGSSGFSIPVASIGGRSVRYRVGRTRGHYVQGAATPAAVDTGTLVITTRRLLFLGARQTRQADFAKLAGYRHDGGAVTLSVTNRAQPITITYGGSLDSWFVERFELALAHFRGTVPELRAQVQDLLEDASAHRPIAPAGAQAP